jgi:hypothetical protein
LHARLPTTLAELQAAWEIWLQLALDSGALSRAEHAECCTVAKKRCTIFAILCHPRIPASAMMSSI